jgi:uracil-DNA glycosylase family 4
MEDKLGIPFTGKTGAELDNTYLPILGLPRSDIHVCNAVLCSRLDYSNPEPADADSCMGIHLGPLLEQVRPTIIVPMGAVACSLWPEINLNLMHGLPMEVRWGAWRGVLWPCYHPSAGIHQSSFMIPLQTDFANLKEFLRRLDASNPIHST